MPPKTTKKKAYKQRSYRKRRIARRRYGQSGLPEWSSGTFTRPLINPSPVIQAHPEVFAPNITYRLYDIAMDQFDRAVLLARAHQQYRIKKVTLRFKPLIDTFSVNPNNTDSVPELYYMIDTQQAISPNVGVLQLKQMGAVPHRFDDKQVTCRFVPGVLDNVNNTVAGGGSFARRTLAPWLNTIDDPFAQPVLMNNTDHKGITWCVEETLGSSANYTVDLIVDMQFKKAAIEPEEGQARALDAQ